MPTRAATRTCREERRVLDEVRQAQLKRITQMNEYLVDLFVRTPRSIPERVVIDLDPTDDTAHGHQAGRIGEALAFQWERISSNGDGDDQSREAVLGAGSPRKMALKAL